MAELAQQKFHSRHVFNISFLFIIGARKLPLDQCEALYKDLSREIFAQNSFFGNAALVWSHAYYHTPTFERILKQHCGESPLISLARDPLLPRVSFSYLYSLWW